MAIFCHSVFLYYIETMSHLKIFSDNKRIIRDYFEKDCTYIAVDTETTGLHPLTDHIIEIGAVKFNRHGIIGGPFDILIKPPVEIPMYITQLTGIDDFMVSKSPAAPEALEAFLDYCGNDQTILVAHNAPFDIHFINRELERTSKTPLKNSIIDTLRLCRAFHPDYKGTEEGPYRLQSLARRFNINVMAAHRANDDARVCMELFKKLVSERRSNSDIQSLAKLALET